MRICVFQSAFTNPHQIEEHSPCQDPSKFTDQHTFDHVWVHKSTAREQVDNAVAEGYDFYFNFMWGQHEDELAGIDACKYFESLGLPSIGLRSKVLERSKNDFYKDARRLGYPRVPGTSKYPLFIKPATSCGSQFVSTNSLCRNREELVKSLDALNQALAPGRAVAGTRAELASNAPTVDGISIPEDVVVQEYISGWDHSVVIIEVGSCPVALTPERYVYPAGFVPYEDFLTFDVKFHPETNVELLRYEDDPKLFTKLQQVALQAFHANQMTGQSWCNVDIRVPRPGHGEPTVLEVNPMPAVFLPPPHDWEDMAIRECFPGGHRALINTLIASHLLSLRPDKPAQARVAEVYTTLSSNYDENFDKWVYKLFIDIFHRITKRIDFSQGTTLELGSGTGLFGRILAQNMQHTPPESDSESISDGQTSIFSSPKPAQTFCITGIELSEGMADKCKQTGVYDKIYRGSVQDILPTIGSFDHIFTYSMLYFLSPEDFSMTMTNTPKRLSKSAIHIWSVTTIWQIWKNHFVIQYPRGGS
ncbi:hypothetical protein ABW21_db0201114 [Orbilia brochopaga]|nr:hypothetical protein ABW21_db0201114 [Drechslerella brochopaga]